MKTSTDSQNTKTKRRLLSALVILALVGLACAFFIVRQTRNFAEEVARPLEKSLAEAGAVKRCSGSAPGRGPDNYEPRYDAVYEVAGDSKAAVGLAREAFKKNGYNLTDGPTPSNQKDNLFYGDKASKQSPYTELNLGPIDLRLTVFGSSTARELCGAKESESPSTDRTTIRFTINLPEFKR